MVCYTSDNIFIGAWSYQLDVVVTSLSSINYTYLEYDEKYSYPWE